MLPRDNLAIEPQGTAPWQGRDFQDVLPVPAATVPASELFCHPSRLANTYEPGVERVHQPASLIPWEEAVLAIRKGRTLPCGWQGFLGWRRRQAARLAAWRGGGCLDLKERLVYDARSVFNGNMAHLVQHHAANLGYLKERLGPGPGDVLVLLDAEPPALARKVFDLLGYEVLATDLAVEANLVDISLEHFFHLVPWVRHLGLDLPPRSGLGKVFVPRRQSRRLANEAEIEAALRARGFEKVYFEDIGIGEQWSILGNADRIVAIHGAALGCLAFQACRGDGRRGRVLELFGAGFVVNPFRKFVAVLGGKWAGCRGRVTPEVARDIDRPGKLKAHAFDDFSLAPEAVEAGLEFLEEGS
ncbi:MAG: capsular polysaccharide biosynthesis protein [Rhodocyclaceae bacterium]|nr:capsular polysaccharide biosynthesis protein [Rhodocyclaceae bacterium]